MKNDFAWHLKDAPVAVVNLAMEGHLAIRRDHNFVLDFLTGEEIVLWVEASRAEEIPPEIAGVYVLSRQREGKMWYAECLYVKPEFRRTGVTTELRKMVMRVAGMDTKVQHIEALVSADNKEMVENMRRAGRNPTNFHYRYTVHRQ